jgi:acyl carrier protein
MDAALKAQIARREAAIAAIKQILIRHLHLDVDPDAIDPDAALFGTGLALDSVDALELVVAAEGAFGVTFPEASLRRGLRTVNSLVDLVLDRQDQKEAA